MRSYSVDFARKELELAGLLDDKSPYGGEVGKAVLELVETFAKQGHTGLSARITSSIFYRLANHLPLTPLTGEDDEWEEIEPGVYQNVRSPNVFKDPDGRAYQIDYYIFVEKSGSTYISRESKRVIESFPYMPSHEYVEVEE